MWEEEEHDDKKYVMGEGGRGGVRVAFSLEHIGIISLR